MARDCWGAGLAPRPSNWRRGRMNATQVILLLAVIAAMAGMIWVVIREASPNVPGDGHTPAERADALLRQVLGEAEFRHLMRSGYLEIASPSIDGRIYRVPYSP